MEVLWYSSTDWKLVERAQITNEEDLEDIFGQYSTVSISFESNTILQPELVNNGLGGIILEEKSVPLFSKDYDANEELRDMIGNWDLKNWCMIIVINPSQSNREVQAGALIASRTEGVNILRGRDDLAVLWDIRVDPNVRGQGIGRKLFDLVLSWSRSASIAELHIETQNNNISACQFYKKMGCKLIKIDMKAYSDLPHEAQLIWEYPL